MTLLVIDSEKMYYAFLSGANEVIKQKYELNKINVFPIPDGDTGTNLSFTMSTIIEEARIGESTKKTMESIADAALNGARGNSGIIFAQFINGLYMGMADKKEISIQEFSESIKKAVHYAYESISNPVEGTMITVMRDWSDSLENMREKVIDFSEFLGESLEVAMQSLKNTPELLKVLKDNSVVDSGAKGFVHFLEGFSNFIKTRIFVKTNVDTDFLSISDTASHVMENPDLSHRYCTEALVKGENIDLAELRNTLSDLGDSLIVAGNTQRAKVHIHTNSPQDLFFKLKEYGQIIHQKADDMLRQFEMVHMKKHKIAVVTDSIADIPQDLVDHHQIHMIPLNLIVEDSTYLDKLTISPSYLYKLMEEAENYPTSSQPTSKVAESYLSAIASNYDAIIVITVSKQMSGTHETLLKAANKLREQGKKIAVIDSKLNSGAQGLVVLKAAEEIAEGKQFEEIIETIEKTIENTSIFVSVDTLKYMVRSGRIKKVQGMVAKLLNLKPVVSIDKEGNGVIIGKALSVKANNRKIKALINEISQSKTIIRYSIVHADAQERANEYNRIFTKLTGQQPTYITNISSIVAMNAGIGCVAIAVTVA